MKKTKYENSWQAGIATLMALAAGFVFLILTENVTGTVIVWLALAIAGEFWQSRLRDAESEGELDPGHPLAEWALVIVLIAFCLLSVAYIISIGWVGNRINPRVLQDGWSLIIFNGIVWDILTFSLLGCGLALASLVGGFTSNRFSKWLSVYPLIIGAMVFLAGLTVIVPLVKDKNEIILKSYRETEIERIH